MKFHFFKISILLVAFICTHPAAAQQDKFGWRLGAAGGLMSYTGDLTDQFRLVQPTPRTIHPFDHIDFKTYGLTAERSLSRAWGLGISYSKGQFTANDRSIDWKGKLQTNGSNFDRSLNALTKIRNYGAYFAYYFDNEKLMGKTAFFAPYLKAGVGVTRFKVYGDLYFGENNQPYYYWPDGTIRNLPEGHSTAIIVEQDGHFETNLTELETEGVSYKTSVFTPMAGLGLKFRLANRLNLNLEYLFHFTQTDYLDDVSGKFLPEYDNPAQEYAANPANWNGEYRGNSNGKDDFYTFATVSLHYNLGRKKEAFFAPAIFTGALPLWEKDTADSKVVLDTVEMDTPPLVDPTETEMADEIQRQQEQISKTTQPDTAAAIEKPAQKTGDSGKEKPAPAAPQPKASEKPLAPVVEQNQQKITALETELATLKSRQDSLESKVDPSVKTQMAGEIKRLEQQIDSLKSTPKTPKPPAPPATAPTKPDDEVQSMRKELQTIKSQLQQRQEQAPQGASDAELAALRAKVQQYEQQLAARNDRRSQQELAALRASIESLSKEVAKPQSVIVAPPAADTGKDQQIAELNARMQEMQKSLDSLRAQSAAPAKPDSLKKVQPDPEVTALKAELDSLKAKIKADELQRKQQAEAEAQALEAQRLQAEVQKRNEAEAQRQAELDAAKQELAEMKEKQAATAEAERKAKALADLKTKIKGWEKKPVYFETGSATLNEQAKSTVQEAAKLLLMHPELIATLNGFTDPSGNRQRNLELSRSRAEAVQQLLVQTGVPADRISIGKGGIDNNVRTPQEGRRVEVSLQVKE